MQVYRYMDIGTAKPSAEERARIPHYLIDIVDPDEDYTLGTFIRDAEKAIRIICSHANTPLLAGGTGLYFKGLLNGLFNENNTDPEKQSAKNCQHKTAMKQELQVRLAKEGGAKLYNELAEVDPETADRIHPNDTQRILRGLEIYHTTGIPWSLHLAAQINEGKKHNVLKVGLTRPREELYDRIDQRVKLMVQQGLLTEVKKLLDMDYNSELKSMQSIGYRHMINYIEGRWDWDKTLELLARDTRRYAKRQFTWFNKDPEILWFDIKEKDRILQAIGDFLIKNNR
jgi:tRNA dimethylallyltransferase